MFQKFAAVCGMIVALSATQAGAQNTLTPRYIQIIGVELEDGWASLLSKGKFECQKIEGNTVVLERFVRLTPVQGVMVKATRPGSPAERAGLRCGDVITSANNKHVHYAHDLQSIVYPLSAESDVSITVRRAVTGSTESEEARITVSLQEPVEIQIKTVTLDRVKALAEQLPTRTREFIDEAYGPLVNFPTTTTFTEVEPGRIQYSCTFAHRGEQEVLPVESPFFFLVGITDTVDLKKNEQRTISLSASVSEQGIPTLTRIPAYFAQRIGMDTKSMEEFWKAKLGSVGVIRNLESSEKNWYHWRYTGIACFLPEALSLQINAKIQRYKDLGIK